MHDIGLSCLWRFWRCAEGMWPFSGRALRRADVGSRKSPVSLGFLMAPVPCPVLCEGVSL